MKNLLTALSIKLCQYKINSESSKLAVYAILLDLILRKGANYLLPIDKIKIEKYLETNNYEENESKKILI